MKEVLMLLLAMIIGFAGGAGMFALILHYCNGNEKSVSKKENNVPTEVCAESFRGLSNAFIRYLPHRPRVTIILCRRQVCCA